MSLGAVAMTGLLSLACQGSTEGPVLVTRAAPLAAKPSPPPSPLPPPPKAPPQKPPQALSLPANVMFLLGNSESMQDFTQYLPEDFTPGFYPPPSSTANGRRGFVGAKEGDFINTGCSDPALVAAMSWFDPNSTDPSKNGSVAYDADPDLGSPFFQSSQFYHTQGRRMGWLYDYPYSLGPDFKSTSSTPIAQSACYEVVNWNTADYYNASTELMDECQTCLATRGWWRGPLITATTQELFAGFSYPPTRVTQTTGQPPPPLEAYRKWVVSGRVLNLHPPKFVVARKAIKDVIRTADNVRLGVASFGEDDGWFDPPWVLAGMRPSCDQSYPSFNTQALNRDQLARAVDSTRFRHNERQAGESLFGLGGYFSSQLRDNKWSNWFSNPINPGYFGWPGCCNGGTYDEPPGTPGHTGFDFGARAPDEWLKPDSVDDYGRVRPGQPWEDFDYTQRSICFADQTTAIIVVTDGTPRYDNAVPITRMMEILKAHGARHADGSLVQFDPTDPESNPNVGGINYCDQVVKNPITGEKYAKTDCDYGPESYNWPTGLGVGNKNFMDDVSFFLAHTDLRDDLPGDQTVRTYVVGYGDNSAMLQSIALAGQGQFYRVNTGDELRQSLQQILTGLGSSTTP